MTSPDEIDRLVAALTLAEKCALVTRADAFSVTNVGARRGSDVVQIYVSPHQPVVPRPPKLLASFAKVHLDPGEKTVARVVLPERAFARCDVATHSWFVDLGTYDVVVAASAVDERFRLPYEIGAQG